MSESCGVWENGGGTVYDEERPLGGLLGDTEVLTNRTSGGDPWDGVVERVTTRKVC